MRAYVLTGMPCAGKTTLARRLSEKWDMRLLHGDDLRGGLGVVPPEKPFFSLTREEAAAWERSVIRSQTPLLLDRILRESAKGRVLFEGMLDLELASRVIPPCRIAFLTVPRDVQEREFYARPDHEGMARAILDQPGISAEEAQRRLRLRLDAALDAFPDEAARYGVPRFVREDLPRMIERVERHFALTAPL